MLKWHFCPPPSLQFFLSNGFHLFLFWKRILVVQDGITLKTRSFSLFHLVQSQTTIFRCHSVCWCHLIFRSPSNDTKDDVNDDHGHMKILNDDVLNLRPRQKQKLLQPDKAPNDDKNVWTGSQNAIRKIILWNQFSWDFVCKPAPRVAPASLQCVKISRLMILRPRFLVQAR